MAVTRDKVLETANSVAKHFHSDDEFKSDYKKYGGGGFLGGLGFVDGLFGIFGGGGGYVRKTNKTSHTITSSNSTAAKSFANAISSLTQTKIKITGNLSVQGISFVPSEGHIFINVMTVKGRDKAGKVVDMKIVSSSDPKVANSAGE